MNLNIKNIKEEKEVVDIISFSILEKLKEGKRVLLFLSGGSSIPIEIEILNIIKNNPHSNLVVTLADERYGPVDSTDSNWLQLLEKGFELPDAKFLPYLNGESIENTVERVERNLKEALNKADYKVAILGIGVDGHTAGIIPHSQAVISQNLICSHDTLKYKRVTITPKVFDYLDEIFVCALGNDKWSVVNSLQEEKSVNDQPAQLFKKVPLSTIFIKHK